MAEMRGDNQKLSNSESLRQEEDDIESQQPERSSSPDSPAEGEMSPFMKDTNRDGHVFEGHPPVDKSNLVYLIVLLHGVGVLLPWNTFLTIAVDYYIGYKFANASSAAYTTNFFNYLTASSQIPNLTLSLINLFVVIKGGLGRRINFSLTIIMFICSVTILMVFIDSTSWPFGFFLFTILTVILLNSANGIYQNCVWGLIADFPPHFTNAVVQGNNLCGIFVTCAYILILLLRTTIKITASIFFGISLLTVVACLFTFHMLPKLDFYRFYTMRARKARDESCYAEKRQSQMNGCSGGEEVHPKESMEHPSLAVYVATVKEVWPQLLDVFLVFFVTLALFPTVLLGINLYPSGRPYDIFIYGDMETSRSLFIQLTIFLNFNFFATVGNFIANYVQWPSPKSLKYAVFARLLFFPLFWSCNYTLNRQNVLIQNEWAVVLLITLMALTHGYYSSLAMMYAPRVVDQSKARVVGMMSGFFLVLGISSGIVFTFIEPYFAMIYG